MRGAATARDTARGPVLLGLVRAEVVAAARGAPPTLLTAAGLAGWLREPRATFVTLFRRGRLRGCIGSLEARLPLAADLVANARAAATRDPRFAPLAAGELDGLDVEVSVLSPVEPLAVDAEEEAWRLLRPGVDGLVLRWRHLGGTFLPQVWEDLAEPRDFLGRLKEKAGLSPAHWDDDCRLFRYTVEKYVEVER